MGPLLLGGPGLHALQRTRLKGWLTPLEAELPKTKEVQAGGQVGGDCMAIRKIQQVCPGQSPTFLQNPYSSLGRCFTVVSVRLGLDPYGGPMASGPWAKEGPYPNLASALLLSYSQGCWVQVTSHHSCASGHLWFPGMPTA